MSSVNKFESEYLRFNINGVDVQLDKLPAVSQKTHQIIEAHGLPSPELRSRESGDYFFKIHVLEQDLKLALQRQKERNSCIVMLALGVVLAAGGIFGAVGAISGLLSLCGDPILLYGFCITMIIPLGGTLIYAAAPSVIDMKKSEIEKTQKELEQLKPKVQQHVKRYLQFFQQNGFTLQAALEIARQRLEGEEGSLKIPQLSEESRALQDLTTALAEVERIQEFAKHFNEEGTEMTVLPPLEASAYAS